MSVLKKVFRQLSKPTRLSAVGKTKDSKVSKLTSLMATNDKRQFTDLIIEDDSGRSHNLSRIEIKENGIFCIDTVSYGGWIYGNETDENWIQELDARKHQFLNPIKHNQAHIYYLNKALGFRYRINSIIVFEKDNADRVNVPYAVNQKDLNTYFKYYNDGTHYNDYQMDNIYTEIKRVRSGITSHEHNKKISDANYKFSQGICPQCGGKLVRRNCKNGSFIGCSNYPKCKFIANIEK